MARKGDIRYIKEHTFLSIHSHCNLPFSIVIAEENFAAENNGYICQKTILLSSNNAPKKPDEISCFLYPPTKDF